MKKVTTDSRGQQMGDGKKLAASVGGNMDVLSRSEQRSGALSGSPWIMCQRWHNLLFAHWPVPPDFLRTLVPAPLEIDTFEGQAWVGIIPFRLTGIRLLGLPALPFVSSFTEINLRTYVTLAGKAGVFFLSMDANNRLGAAIARHTFRVPYTYADLSLTHTSGRFEFECERRDARLPLARFAAEYQPVSRVYHSDEGSLEEWLTERYCYYQVKRGNAYRCEIAHARWPLQRVTAQICTNTMASSLGIDLPACEPVLHYVHRLDALFGWVRRVECG